MRRVAGIGLFVLGLLGVLLGGGVAFALGPDDQLTTGPHAVDTEARAIVTRPAVMTRYGPQVSLLVEAPEEKAIFIGVANTVDLDDYLSATARVEVTGYQVPWDVETRDVDGDPQLPAAPTAMDWWQEGTASLGGAQLRFRLPDETVSLAVLAVGDANLADIEISASYEVPGGFGVAVGTAVASLGVFLVALVLLRLTPGSRRAPAWDAPALADDEWDDPWLETDPSDADTWDDFLAEAESEAGGETAADKPDRETWRDARKARKRDRDRLVGAGAGRADRGKDQR